MDGTLQSSSPVVHDISLSPLQRQILDEFVGRRQSAYALVARAEIILSISVTLNVSQTARDVSADRKTVRLWRDRWIAASVEWEKNSKDWVEKVWREKIEALLADALHSGRPSTFKSEDVSKIVALACRKPQDFAIPVSHWSASDLQREVIKQKIIPKISVRQVGRFLKRQTSSRTACGTI
jgi:putative transposase